MFHTPPHKQDHPCQVVNPIFEPPRRVDLSWTTINISGHPYAWPNERRAGFHIGDYAGLDATSFIPAGSTRTWSHVPNPNQTYVLRS